MQLKTIKRWAYIQLISYFNLDFYINLFSEKILALNILLDCFVKVIKLLYNMSKASIKRFAIYCLYYKKKL